MSRPKIFSGGGAIAEYKPHSEETRQRIREAALFKRLRPERWMLDRLDYIRGHGSREVRATFFAERAAMIRQLQFPIPTLGRRARAASTGGD